MSRCVRCEGKGWVQIDDARWPGAHFARPCNCSAGARRAETEAWRQRRREPLPALEQGEAEEPY